MRRRAKEKPYHEERNPYGKSFLEFVNDYPGMKNLAQICWFFGMYPEELKEELKLLMEDKNE